MSRQLETEAEKAFFEKFHEICDAASVDKPSLKNKLSATCNPLHICKDVFTKEDVIKEIRNARSAKDKKLVRVCGSEHSRAKHILGENEAGILLSLKGDLEEVTIHPEESTDEKLYVTAGGGCVLGYNPNKENKREKSLCYKVNEAGFALPDLGGITHQTVAGFLSTGSAGGSLIYSLTDSIEEITFINGKAQEQTCSRNDSETKDLFFAVGVSMGLFGVITKVKFCLENKQFNVVGNELSVKFKESLLNKPEKLDKVKDGDYWRLNWFPQKGLNKVMQWRAVQTNYDEHGTPYENPVNCCLSATAAAFAMVACNIALYQALDECPDGTTAFISTALAFFNINKCDPKFNDTWYHGLPMDNEAHVDDFIKVDFTEIWIPFKHRADVIERLKQLFKDSKHGQKAAGNFAVEIYPAKKSDFWLSMSYDEDMIRVDPYWYHHNPYGTAEEYFTYFWNQLLPSWESPTVRFHWGKFLPKTGEKYQQKPGGDSVCFDSVYLESVYPKMKEWKELRQEHDPDQMFVTNYWREILGIKAD
ncbi:uncharacterized protein LOC124448464 [Xenia sp. Carnegie-2017]|uniref:uncharacterized protein LOC124448464 n=1 Tax=Xenia sp. Carnegie-2017 TaxID=2897299 RepID=UPI001F04A08B|nr:uncharacterized protein LOC124448464 [Xenia sp. Carnegie-2017]